MIKIKSFSVGNGDMFYIRHGSDSFTVIDCNLLDDIKEHVMDEICRESMDKSICRFISTHPDEDHIRGISYFNERKEIMNFYCVKNNAIKNDEESPSFKFYRKIRDNTNKTYYIERGCKRKWMNEKSEERGCAGIDILWPIKENDKFKEALEKAEAGENDNNISPIIKYSIDTGFTALWFGDLEHHFMESIEDVIELPQADVVFAPHHGRLSGAVPQKWLKQISPKVIILGEAPSSELKYFSNYNQITQNLAKDITMVCDGKKIHFYSSNVNYGIRKFLYNEYKSDTDGYYIGTLNL